MWLQLCTLLVLLSLSGKATAQASNLPSALRRIVEESISPPTAASPQGQGEDREVLGHSPAVKLSSTEGKDFSMLSEVKITPRRKRQLFGSNLKWVTFTGRLPEWAVSNWNNYAKRQEYVCAVSGCDTGSYSPERGPYCYYPYGEKERSSTNFKILVNEGNRAWLEWRSASFGNAPSNAVKSCPWEDVYVGRNKYGLGKVHGRHRAFFVVTDGYESWYKYYEVLTVRRD
ncbi:natterin-3-like [Apteryx mantelli]|uniref:Natterin-3-like n=1 Tax=Apteryx mantelli TaxID=2696672 RepID=A0ABM4FZT2_9AVES|nr:natterin-3-like [Apteryx rowi]